METINKSKGANMTTISHSFATRPMVLRLSTAAELMTRNPLSFGKSMPIHAASALLDSCGLTAAAIVDEFGRPEGLITRSACDDWREYCVRSRTRGFTSEGFDLATVVEIATPVVETVHSDESTREVIDKLLQNTVRRVYVVNDAGRLVGVVSITDVLRQLLADGIGPQMAQAGAL
jgi:CBS domain-containing protein